MDASRAITFLEQHTLRNLKDDQARQDWLQELELDNQFPVESLDDLVRVGAAVDHYDAADIMRTATLCSLQPHRQADLQRRLADRRGPRMRAARAASSVPAGS